MTDELVTSSRTVFTTLQYITHTVQTTVVAAVAAVGWLETEEFLPSTPSSSCPLSASVAYTNCHCSAPKARYTLATKSNVADTVDFVADTINFVVGFGNKSATT